MADATDADRKAASYYATHFPTGERRHDCAMAFLAGAAYAREQAARVADEFDAETGAEVALLRAVAAAIRKGDAL